MDSFDCAISSSNCLGGPVSATAAQRTRSRSPSESALQPISLRAHARLALRARLRGPRALPVLHDLRPCGIHGRSVTPPLQILGLQLSQFRRAVSLLSIGSSATGPQFRSLQPAEAMPPSGLILELCQRPAPSRARCFRQHPGNAHHPGPVPGGQCSGKGSRSAPGTQYRARDRAYCESNHGALMNSSFVWILVFRKNGLRCAVEISPATELSLRWSGSLAGVLHRLVFSIRRSRRVLRVG